MSGKAGEIWRNLLLVGYVMYISNDQPMSPYISHIYIYISHISMSFNPPHVFGTLKPVFFSTYFTVLNDMVTYFPRLLHSLIELTLKQRAGGRDGRHEVHSKPSPCGAAEPVERREGLWHHLDGRSLRHWEVQEAEAVAKPWRRCDSFIGRLGWTHRIHGAGIYANIGGILMVNVTIYNIHGSYGE